MALKPKRRTAMPLAIFFYTGDLTQAQVETVDAYFAASGYYVGYRKKLDAVGNRDVIEFDAVCISGNYPSIYTTKFATDVTKVLDTTPIANILDGTAAAAPKPASPMGRMAAMSAPDDGYRLGESAETQTVQTAVAPLAPPPPAST